MGKRTAKVSMLWKRISVWLATGIGVGLVTPAPGTVAGLWGLPLSWAILHLEHRGVQLLVILLTLVFCSIVCGVAARQLDRKDPQEIVIDEIAVLPIVFYATGASTGKILVVGWLLFRLFDIWKPFPVRQAERLPGGWGIMADDAIAACYAAVALWSLLWLDVATEWNWFIA